MKVKNLLLIVLSLAVMSFITACGGGNDSSKNLCGNGVIDEGEECDASELGGATCPQGKVGNPTCTSECKLDFATCKTPDELCGNGVLDEGEECDGDQFRASSCHDADKTYKDGTGTLACNDDCTYNFDGCELDYKHEVLENCDPLGGKTECAPHNGKPSDCNALSSTSGVCLQQCTAGTDCGFAMDCLIKGHCYVNLCGPMPASNGWPGGDTLNSTCQFTDGREGFCVPQWHATDNGGICIENGEAEHGDACDNSDVWGELNVDKSKQCNAGNCIDVNKDDQGTCLSFCDPVGIYNQFRASVDGSSFTNPDTCPTNYTCVNYTDIDTDTTDPWGKPNDYILFRTPDFGLCLPAKTTETVDGSHIIDKDIVTCDIISGKQIHTGELCPAGQKCLLFTYASLIGVCGDVEDASEIPVGSTCSLDDNSNNSPNCEAGSVCFIKDPFNDQNFNDNDQNTDPEFACVKTCIVQDLSDGLDDSNEACAAGEVCMSTSLLFTPDHSLPTTEIDGKTETEGAPSQLGFCVPPQASGN